MTAIFDAPLEERDRELAAVGRVLDAARAGTGAGLLVEGPPGIGKTRLLGCARAAAGEGMRVLAARASGLERDFPFAIARQLLEPALAEPALLEGAAALAEPVLAAPAGGAAADGPAALHGLYWLTANLAAREPLLVLVDDLQWADMPSLRWLAYLAQRLDGLPVAVIGGARLSEAGDGQCVVLDVLAANPDVEVLHPAGLSAAAVARVVERWLGPGESEFAAACRAVTGGNPFLLSELARELAVGEVAPSAENAGLVARQTSRTVSRAALARLRRLPAPATPLARAVVVLGDGAELALAAELAGLDPATASDAADALAAAAILAPGRPLAVVHPLVGASVYAELSAGERTRAHARAAELLAAAGAPAERVAVHFHECDPLGDERAVRVLREAARDARRRGATEVAVSHLRRALREPPPREVEPHLRWELGAAELQSGAMEAAIQQLDEAMARLGDPVARATAAGELGTALQLSNRPVEAVTVLNQAIAELPDDQRELGLVLQAGRAAASQGDLAADRLARDAGLRFLAPIDAPATPGERLHVAGLANREATAGRAARARELALRALGGGELLTGPNLGSVFVAPIALLFSGALEEATRAFGAILDWAGGHGSALAFAQASHLRAAAWWRRGELAEAEADAENALAHPSFMVRPGVLALVEIRLVQGDPEGAARVWREAGMDAEPTGGRAAVGTLYVRARLRAAAGRSQEALADLMECGRLEAEWGTLTPAHTTWRSDAAALLASLGRGEEARVLAAEEVERCRAFGDPRPLGMALRAAGLAAGREGGLRLLQESVDTLRDSPARLEHALSLLELGAALRRAGRRADAREPLREAIERARECGARAVAARAHDELVAAGARPRRDPIESRSRLTASELRVARMAADGMTNREIAQALFLTEKTIEVHLTSTYRKLEIASRSQLPRALAA